MMSARRLLAAGIAIFLLGLVLLFPARVLHGWFAPAAVRIAGIEGTAWHGRAAEAMIGDAYLRNLSWSLRPLALLRGRLAYRIAAEPVSGFVEGEVAIGLTGNVSLDTLRAALPLAALSGVLPLGGVSGDVTLALEDVLLEDGWPRRLGGQAGVANLVVRPLAASALGDFRAEFQTADDAIVGSVEDLRGVLDVAATLTLSPDRSYALVGRVGATPAAPRSVVEQLAFLGSADARGLREFRLEGRL